MNTASRTTRSRKGSCCEVPIRHQAAVRNDQGPPCGRLARRAQAVRYRYIIELPPRGLGQNSRGHWSKKADLTSSYKMHVASRIGHRPATPIEQSRIEITAYICRKRVTDYARSGDYRPRDETNLADALKPAIDALQGLVIVDDDAKHCRVEMPRIIEVESHDQERIEIEVEEAL